MEYEIKPKSRVSLDYKELIIYKELFYFFTWRDIKVKYKQTVLGFLWSIIQPLFMMLIFTVFFGKKAQIETGTASYPVFVFSGLLLWNIFSSGLTNAGNSMVTNASVIKKIYFPRLIIPISSVLVALFDFFIALILFVCVVVYYEYTTPFEIEYLDALLILIICLFITCIATLGLGCFLAALNVKYRDVRYMIPFMVQLLLFMTPVIYPSNYVDNIVLKYLLSLNPLSGAIDLFRLAICNTPIDFHVFTISILSNVFLFVFGIYYFKKTEMYFADLA